MIDVRDETTRKRLVRELESLGCYGNEGYTLSQLKMKWTAAKAFEEEINNLYTN